MAGAKVRSISCILDNLSCILIYRAADTLTYMFTFIVAKLVLIFTFSFLDGLISEFDFNLITEKNQDEMLIFKPRKKIDPHQYIVVLVQCMRVMRKINHFPKQSSGRFSGVYFSALDSGCLMNKAYSQYMHIIEFNNFLQFRSYFYYIFLLQPFYCTSFFKDKW